jgi:DNA-binding transcriptional regulator YhcF (GntR family)
MATGKCMRISLAKKDKLYDQITRAIRREILKKYLVAGSKLRFARALATALGVSGPSVHRGYDLLRAEKLAIAHGESGLANLSGSAKIFIATKQS